jgi:CelD/BcsL family acetyltransferase involved in cellulose biosynthesis
MTEPDFPLVALKKCGHLRMYWIDPLRDVRWASFVSRHPQGSVFHTPSWLEALRRTYGYRPIVLTSRPHAVELVDGIPFCEVKSWINGSRLVSLPFSDHCQPLLECAGDFGAFTACLGEHRSRSHWQYVEIRVVGGTVLDREGLSVPTKSERQCDDSIPLGLNGWASDFGKYEEYNFHRINLRSDLGTLFSNFHKSCIQRKIHRAERERLEYEAGRSESDLAKFYRLLLLTRRRHGLPPQPITWFRNLKDCFGESFTIRVASKDGQPIAAILTLLHKSTLVYKYGCSDAALHKLGAMPMLFWKAIQEGKHRGAEEFDLGRSNIDDPGLAAFKQHLGAACSKLTYFRLGRNRPEGSTTDRRLRIARAAFARMPGQLAQMAGRMVYRHFG